MTPEEIRNKTDAELSGLIKDLRESLFNLRMQKGTGQLDKTHRLKEVKRDIARVLTIMGQKTKK